MTPGLIAGIVGAVISLLMQYAEYKGWKFADWYNNLPDTKQKLFMIGTGFVVVLVAFGLGCFELIAAYWACTWPGAYQAGLAWLAFVLANQTTYALLLKKGK